MEVRHCTSEHPMPMEQKDDYFWIHPDAQEVMPFFGGYVIYECPHCKLAFHALPRGVPR